jgi:hypothetical protein
MRHRDTAAAASGDTGDYKPAGVEDRVTRAQRVKREYVRLLGKELGEGLRRHGVKRCAGLLRRGLVGEEIDGGSDRVFGPASDPRGTFLHRIGPLPEAVAERLRLRTKGEDADKSCGSTNQ